MGKGDIFEAWVTKYVLTAGIQRVRVRHSGIGDMVTADRRFSHQNYHGEGKDWHRTPEAAVARAEEVRRRKVKSLQASLDKLQARDFAAEAELLKDDA